MNDSLPQTASTVADARTLPELLLARAFETPQAEAVRFETSSLTCLEVLRRADALAHRLRDEGVQPGDRVAVMVPNGTEFPLAWMAAMLLRAVTVPVNVMYGPHDLAHVLTDSEAKVLLVGPDQVNAAKAVLSAAPPSVPSAPLSVMEFPGGASDEPSSTSGPGTGAMIEEWRGAEPTEAVTIQYTSGTTGLPKGCVLHHGYWLRLARTLQEYAKLGPDDVLLTAQPQSYMDPSWNLILALLVGAPLVVLPRFSASTFWRDVGRSGATFFYCIGTMPHYLLKRPSDRAVDRGHRVRLVYCSGIPPSLHREFERRWGCVWRETYGTTELGVVLAADADDVTSVGSGSMGRSVPGREVRVVDEDDLDVAPGEAGELLVRGPDTMLEYHNDPAATGAWRSGVRRSGAWVRTGDLVEEASEGFRLVGRTKDMIRRAGENIAAAEVEAVLGEHPEVTLAACIAVPDEARGEEVKAYVQRVPESGVGAEEIHAFVGGRLARFKVPRYIEFVESLPLTHSEKVAKAALVGSRDDHRAGSWDAEAPVGTSE
jgi:crotonobetaine/carnitine-CoA ligase